LNPQLDELKNRLRDISALNNAAGLLNWDQLTLMPPGGAAARGLQQAVLSRIAAEKSIDPALGKLIEDLLPYAGSLPAESDDACLIRLAKYDFDKAVNVPPEFVARAFEQITRSYQAWAEARPANDYAKVLPELEKNLELSREYAAFFKDSDHIADPLIDDSDPGMKAADIQHVFAELRAELVPIVKAITSQAPADDACLKQHFPSQIQLDFGKQVADAIGYDFNRGRMDLSPHPFTTRFSIGDVRITTRVREDDLGDSLFSIIHEAGHAMYEQGISTNLEGLPLARGTSSGVHESQSRTWENIVGRSLPFWEHFYPKLKEAFPGLFDSVPLETFYRAINKVQPSFIRTDADEVTYNLHVMIRFDLELALLEGKLALRDLPEAWNERYRTDLGITPPDLRSGCLQDVHWFGGLIGGGFQGYTLGNIMSTQFMESALQAHPEIYSEMTAGRFDVLHGWLIDNIYTHGRKFFPNQLLEKVTGQQIQIAPYIRYLKDKYGKLYEL
jgi:carboxypeptidase Taq